MRSQLERRKWVGFLGILALGLLLRFYLIFGNGAAIVPELFEYDELARNLLAGEGYVYSHRGTPYRSLYSGIFYVWITAGLYAVAPPGHTAVLIVQSFFSVLLAAVIFLIGQKLWSYQAGLLAAFLTITHPTLAYYDTHKLHPLSFDSLMISMALLSLLCLRGSSRSTQPLFAGVALGVGVLQRGSLLLLLPLGLLWLWFFAPKDRPLFRLAAAYLLGVVLMVTPWVVRNYQIHGAPILLTTTGEHFWVGNAPHSYGSNLLPSGQTVLESAPEEFRRELFTRNEWDQSQLFWEYGLAQLRDRPTAFLLGTGRKFLSFWSFASQSGIQYPRSYFTMYAIYYFTVAAFGILGAVLLAQTRFSETFAFPGLLLILALFFSISAIQSIFYVELRHRWAIEPMLLVLSSIGLLSVWHSWKEFRVSSLGFRVQTRNYKPGTRNQPL